MKIRIEPFSLDLGETSFENIFLNQYLKMAPSHALRVYLYAYKEAKSPTSERSLDEESLGKTLGLSTEEVQDAWSYWLGQGVVRPLRGEPGLEFLSLRQLMLGHSALYDPGKPVPPKEEDLPESWEHYRDRIEGVLGTALTPPEILSLEEFRKEHGVSRELITRGFEHLDSTGQKKNVSYTLAVVRNWIINGIKTPEELTLFLEEEKRLKEAQKKRRGHRQKAAFVKRDTRYEKNSLDELMYEDLTKREEEE